MFGHEQPQSEVDIKRKKIFKLDMHTAQRVLDMVWEYQQKNNIPLSPFSSTTSGGMTEVWTTKKSGRELFDTFLNELGVKAETVSSINYFTLSSENAKKAQDEVWRRQRTSNPDRLYGFSSTVTGRSTVLWAPDRDAEKALYQVLKDLQIPHTIEEDNPNHRPTWNRPLG